MVVQRTKAMYGSGRIYTPCRNLTENRNILIQGENMNMKKLVSALLAALMLVGIGLCAIPKNAFALPRKDVTVPEGYPEYEYLALVDILEQVDANGVKNGYKLNPDYDPEDPDTWVGVSEDGGWVPQMINWNYDPDTDSNYCGSIDFTDCGMVGTLYLAGGFEKLEYIDVPGNSFSELAVDESDWIQRIDVAGSPIGSIDVTGFRGLKSLSVIGCGLTELDISQNGVLRFLYCGDNEISELDFSNKPELSWVEVENNRLTELDVSGLEGLSPFNCSGNELTRLDLSNNTELWSVDCSNNRLTELLLPNGENLSRINCANNNLTSIDIAGIPALQTIDVSNNSLTELQMPATVGEYFDFLDISGNPIKTIDLSGIPTVEQLFVNDTEITQLDLSANTNIMLFDMDYMDEIALVSNYSNDNCDLPLYPCNIRLTQNGGGAVKLKLNAEEDENSGLWPRPYINSAAVISARANDGFAFEGWFDAAGELVSTDAELTFTDAALTLELEARFKQSDSPVTPEPTDKPTDVPTEDPTDAPTEAPTAPATPVPTNPPTPSTGAFSIAACGFAAIAAGAGAVLCRKRRDEE